MNVVARGEIASALSEMILERLTSYHLTVFMDIQTFLQALFSFVVVAGGDFVSLTDKQLARYEKIYHFPIVFLPTPHGLLAMKCTPEQYEQFQRDGNKLKSNPSTTEIAKSMILHKQKAGCRPP